MPAPPKRARGREAQALLEALPLAAASLVRRRDAPPEARYVGDPVGFIEHQLGEFVWSKQREIAESVVNNPRTAVPSAFNMGKSRIASRIVAWWLASWPFGDAFVVTTAPTASQVRSILWREVARAYWGGKLPGRLNQTEWFMLAAGTRYNAPAPGEELVALGRKSSDYDSSSFQGIHARRVLVVIDEASGVSSAIFDAAESLASNDDSRILAIGNPTDPACKFAEVCTRPGSQWNVVRIDAYESPNWSTEEVPADLHSVLMGKRYARQVAEDSLMVQPGEELIPAQFEVPDDDGEPTWWGHNSEGEVVEATPESATFKARVRGQFSADDPEAIVPLSEVRRCQIEHDPPWTPAQLLPVELGVDVGAGGDATSVRERRGVLVGRKWAIVSNDWRVAVNLVLDAIRESGATVVKVDVVGIGWGIAGRLEELYAEGKQSARVVRVSAGAASTDPTRWPKLRDQLWWEVGRGLSVDRAWDLTGLDEATVAQLTAPRRVPTSDGRSKVEPKEKTIERLHHSPDEADALLMAYYVEPGTSFNAVAGGQRPATTAPQPGVPAVGGGFNPAQLLGQPIKEGRLSRNGY